MMKNPAILLVGAIFVISGCNFSGKKRVPDFGEKVNEQKDGHEVKRINEGEIFNKSKELGGEIASQAQKALIQTLTKAIEEKGLEGAVEHCNLVGLQIVEEAGKNFNASVKRTALKYRNKANKPTDKEQELLEAYEFNAENNLAMEDNIQLVDDGKTVLFTRAIMLGAPLCLNCHGTTETDILPAIMSSIQELYPDDMATGFSPGEFRGMWAISIPKREVIKRIGK